MEGTRIYFVDNSTSNDHTYYGNGCSDYWENTPPYYGGSPTACETRITKTADNENQINGVYYNFQAATVGTGSGTNTENTNAPDSFCPLGWKLPYSGTGGDYYNQSKSWRYLFNKYKSSSEDNPVHINGGGIYPLSINKPGGLVLSVGTLYQQGVNGYYQSSTAAETQRVYVFDTWWSKNYVVSEGAAKTTSYPVRCFHRRHGGRNTKFI